MGFPWSYRLLCHDSFSFKSEPHLTPPRNPTGAVVTSHLPHRTPRTWWKRAELGTGIPDHYSLLCYRHFSLKSEPNLKAPRFQNFTWDIEPVVTSLLPPNTTKRLRIWWKWAQQVTGFLGRGSLLCYYRFPLKSEPHLTLPQTPKTQSWRRSHTRYHRTPRT